MYIAQTYILSSLERLIFDDVKSLLSCFHAIVVRSLLDHFKKQEKKTFEYMPGEAFEKTLINILLTVFHMNQAA